VTLDQIRACLDSRGPNGVRGWGRIDRLVEQRLGTKPTGSGKETNFLSGLRRRKLPIPVAQYLITDDTGRFVARPDFAYPDIKLAIEVDGGHHMDPAQWEADLARQNRLILAGWRFLRFPRTDRKGQRGAFATIEAALLAFGEPDPPVSRVELPKRRGAI
jgi:very-short-patch-repair endonuclease